MPILIGKTMRAWIPNIFSDMAEDIVKRGLRDVILDVVRLDHRRLTSSGNVLYDPAEDSTLADLAVLRRGMSQVFRHYRPVSSPLNDSNARKRSLSFLISSTIKSSLTVLSPLLQNRLSSQEYHKTRYWTTCCPSHSTDR